MELGQDLLLVEDRHDDRYQRRVRPRHLTRHTIPSDTPAGKRDPRARSAPPRRASAARGTGRARRGRGAGRTCRSRCRYRSSGGAGTCERRPPGAASSCRSSVATVGSQPCARTRSRSMRAGVAAVVVPGGVVLAPEPAVGGHRDDEARLRMRPPGAARPAPLRRRAGARSRRWRTAGRSARPRRGAPRSSPRALRRGRAAGRTPRPAARGPRPRRARARRNSIRLRPVPQPASRMRGRGPAARRGGSAPRSRDAATGTTSGGPPCRNAPGRSSLPWEPGQLRPKLRAASRLRGAPATTCASAEGTGYPRPLPAAAVRGLPATVSATHLPRTPCLRLTTPSGPPRLSEPVASRVQR